MEKVILSSQQVISEAKRLQKEIRKSKNWWSIEACVESVCDNELNEVSPSERTAALEQAEKIDNGEE